MKEIFKKLFSKELLITLLLFNTVLHYLNFGFEKVDLPNATKKLVIETIKNELAYDQKTKEIKNLENVLDEISYANQMGRLDTISLILALFGLVLGFGAVVGFMHIKETSHMIAREETKDWLKKNANKIIKDIIMSKETSNDLENKADFIAEAKREAKDLKDGEDFKD